MSIVTPKVSYLMVNQPKVKIYGTAGPSPKYPDV